MSRESGEIAEKVAKKALPLNEVSPQEGGDIAKNAKLTVAGMSNRESNSCPKMRPDHGETQ